MNFAVNPITICGVTSLCALEAIVSLIINPVVVVPATYENCPLASPVLHCVPAKEATALEALMIRWSAVVAATKEPFPLV